VNIGFHASFSLGAHLFKNFDLLLGRKTYEIFAGYWPYYDEDATHGGIAKVFKDIKKYVVSRSGEVDTSWAGSVLLRDIADANRLKQEDGPNLVTQGSTELVHALFAHDLVDAMSILTVPIVLGSGKKLFADGSAPHSFKLTRSCVASERARSRLATRCSIRPANVRWPARSA
jgi:dihydrofolate reductase